jgi:YD repeat-containing protein
MLSAPHKSRRRARFIVLAAALFGASSALVSTANAATYAYDAQGRLISSTSDGGTTTHYCYDSAGNRTYVGPSAC